jgi:CAAX prenyl protease-like protein
MNEPQGAAGAGGVGPHTDSASGPWSHVLPYFAFGAVLALPGGGALAAGLFGAQVAVPAALLAYFAARGAYPELRGPSFAGGAWLGDVMLGLAIAALWLGPFLLFEALPRPSAEEGFEVGLLGSSAATLALRLVGFALVTPLMEELFVRSFLLRFLDVFDSDADFRSVPIGRFAWRSFLGTVVWFTVTHQTWEWIVALPTGILLNVWLYRRRRMASVVLAHAVANAAIFVFVVLRAPSHPDLWIFL